MTDKTANNRAFRELEKQNPEVARAFRVFRRRAQPPAVAVIEKLDLKSDKFFMMHYYDGTVTKNVSSSPMHRYTSRKKNMLWPVVAVLLLVAGIIALGISVGPSVIRFLGQHWQAIILPVGGVCVGAGIVLLVSRLGTTPLCFVDPPKKDSNEPLHELKDLAERTASRLRAAYRFQLFAVLTVGVIFVGLIVWSIVMVSQKKILYASAFGSGGMAMVILSQWKWQPFDRINQARRLADNADTLATGLQLRMKTISEIQDPRERAKAQWEAVEQFIDRT